MSISVSLTTLPTRESELRQTLRALLQQTCPPDQIYVTVCPYYKRLDLRLPKTFIAEYQGHPIVRLRSAPDDGPASKFLGSSDWLGGREETMIFCDDDVLYPPHAIATLTRYLEKNPDCAVGLLGRALTPTFRFNESHRVWDWPLPFSTPAIAVDLLMAVGMIAIRGHTLPRDLRGRWEKALASGPTDALRVTDDIFLNAVLNENGTPRYVVGGWKEEGRLKTAAHPLWTLNEDGKNNDLALRYFRKSLSPLANGRARRLWIQFLVLVASGRGFWIRVGAVLSGIGKENRSGLAGHIPQ